MRHTRSSRRCSASRSRTKRRSGSQRSRATRCSGSRTRRSPSSSERSRESGRSASSSKTSTSPTSRRSSSSRSCSSSRRRSRSRSCSRTGHDPDLRSWELGEAARRRYRHRFRELLLEPLDAPSSGAASRQRQRDATFRTRSPPQLAERTGGNPLFLEEAARDAVERGDGAAVPAAIQETLQARLDRLAPDVARRRLCRVRRRPQLRPAAAGTTRPTRAAAPGALGAAAARPGRRRAAAADAASTASGTASSARRRTRACSTSAAATCTASSARRWRSSTRTSCQRLTACSRTTSRRRTSRRRRRATSSRQATRRERLRRRGGDRQLPARAFVSRSARRRGEGAAGAVQDRADAPPRVRLRGGQRRLGRGVHPPAPAARRRLAPTERLETSMLRARLGARSRLRHRWRGRSRRTSSAGLLRLERGLDVVPDLAERVAVSADGCTYMFQLRDDLRWSDGEPLGAADFAETYAAMQRAGCSHRAPPRTTSRREPWTS